MSANPRLLADRYRLLSVVARGGMGQVWEGRDELLGRTVAIKEVHFPSDVPEAERAVLGERTMREARLTARLTHRGIVTIYDVICVDDDPYIVMELVRAPSLAQQIDEHGPLPPNEVAEIGLQLLDALAAAHRQGIVHRDVKPSNVLLADDRVVLTDFGIATSESDATLTSTGLLIGSPTYMSPERLHGEGIGPPADLWSLGATLYAALEAEPPFRATTTMGTITAVLADDPRPPDVTGTLREAILRMLDKDVETRLTGREATTLLRNASEEAISAPVLPAETSTLSMPPSPPVMAPIVSWEYPARTTAQQRAQSPVPDGLSILQPGSGSSAGTSPPAGSREGGSVDDAEYGGWSDDEEDPTPPRRRLGLLGALTVGVAVALVALIAWTQLGSSQETTGSGQTTGLGQKTGSGQVTGSTSSGSSNGKEHGGKQGGKGNRPDKHTPKTKSTSSATATSSPTTALTSPTSPSVSAPTSTVPSTPTPTPTETPGTGGAASAGFDTVQDPLGFQIAVPAGWQRRLVAETRVDYYSPTNSAMYLRVEYVATAGPSALGAWQQYEPSLAASHAGYQLLRLKSVAYRGWEAADLEFTWQTDSGTTVHVLDRGFIVPPRGFAILMSGPDDTWESQSLPVFNMAASTFSPTATP